MAKRPRNASLTKAERATLKEQMAAAAWRLIEEVPRANVVVIHLATEGKRGEVFTEYGKAHSQAAKAVADAGYVQEWGETPEGADTADVTDEDEESED